MNFAWFCHRLPLKVYVYTHLPVKVDFRVHLSPTAWHVDPDSMLDYRAWTSRSTNPLIAWIHEKDFVLLYSQHTTPDSLLMDPGEHCGHHQAPLLVLAQAHHVAGFTFAI